MHDAVDKNRRIMTSGASGCNARPIGGYLQLDSVMGEILPMGAAGWNVNSGRSALELILLSHPRVKRLFMPDYWCQEAMETVSRLGVKVKLYAVNDRLEIAETITPKTYDLLLIVNYFGIKDRYVYEIAKRYPGRVIIDNCQGWYAPVPAGAMAIYSPRKFFGVPDGGVAVAPDIDASIWESSCRSESYGRCKALLRRVEEGPEAAYADFLEAERSLGEEPLKRMSHLTDSILRNLPYREICRKRLSNFQHLHSRLGSRNHLFYAIDPALKGPMAYPLWSNAAGELRRHLIENRIFVARYWPGLNQVEKMPQGSIAELLAENIIPLPIDQRYDFNDMERILNVIQQFG